MEMLNLLFHNTSAKFPLTVALIFEGRSSTFADLSRSPKAPDPERALSSPFPSLLVSASTIGLEVIFVLLSFYLESDLSRTSWRYLREPTATTRRRKDLARHRSITLEKAFPNFIRSNAHRSEE